MARGPRFFYFKYQQRFLRPPFTFFLLVFPPRVSSLLGFLAWPQCHRAPEHSKGWIHIYQGSKEDNLVHIILMRSVEKEKKSSNQVNRSGFLHLPDHCVQLPFLLSLRLRFIAVRTTISLLHSVCSIVAHFRFFLSSRLIRQQSLSGAQNTGERFTEINVFFKKKNVRFDVHNAWEEVTRNIFVGSAN